MQSQWIIHSNAKNDKNAGVLFNRFARQLQGEIIRHACESGRGAGYKVLWTMRHNVDSWSELLLEVLTLAQNVGNGWQLTGDVKTQCAAWCNRPKVAGVQLIEWSISREPQRPATQPLETL